MNSKLVSGVAVLLLSSSAFAGPARPTTPATSAASAQSSSNDAIDEDAPQLTERQKRIQQAFMELRWESGPVHKELGHGVTLDLPSGYRFIDKAQTNKLRAAFGNESSEGTLGMVKSEETEAPEESAFWSAYLDYEDEGFIKDDEPVDEAELFKALRTGQEEANKRRVTQGHPALTLTRWVEKPNYVRAQHHLVWALGVKAADAPDESANYNTRILGRRGYVSLNLVTDVESLEANKVHAQMLLGKTSFVAGERYQDFDAKNDKVAEYGLAGLILGGAGLGAAKLGAKVGVFALLAKGGKGLIALLLAPAAALKKLFGAKNKPKDQQEQ
jgi:uncharacterized membrane-anchored protein